MVLKTIPATGFARLTEAVTTEFGQLIELVRAALQAQVRTLPGGGDYYVEIQGIWPDRVVARIRGRLFSYLYALAADNTVTVGAGAEVVANYTAVREAAGAPLDTPSLAAISATVGAIDSGAFREAADGSIEVTLLRAGASINRNYYGDALLREAVAQFEGVRVFVKSDDEHSAGKGKAVANLIGGIYGVRFVEGAQPDSGVLVGTFKPLDPSDAVVTKMTEAVKRGMQGLMGLSIDAVAKTKKRVQGTTTLREATKFTKVHSVDLIVEPGAGGGLDRLTEAAADDQPPVTGAKTMPLWKQRMLEAIKAKDPVKHATINAETVGEDELAQLYESVCGSLVPAPGEARVTEGAVTGDNAPVTRAEFAMLQMRQTAAASISTARLPQASRDRLAAQFGNQARFTEADVTAAIRAEGDYLARLTESGAVRVPAFGGPGHIEVGDRSVQMRDMLDAFFDPAHANHRRVQSFREAYIEFTGDRRVTGQLTDCDMPRLRESAGDAYRESVTSTTFAAALGDAITRRMQALYTGETELAAWRRVATSGPVSDFRSQRRIRIGGYGNLPTVGQGAPYAALTSPGDEEATYVVAKRGGTEDVTLEAIVNDDVQALRRIPQELSLAAANTLYEFVFDFYRGNPTIYDSLALYHASHNNLFTVALSAQAFAAHRLAMLKQTRAGSAKRLAVAPARIMVPFELQEVAYDLFVRNQNLDKTFVQSINPEVIPVTYWTDGNDWVTLADPARLPVVEVGFLGGREEPELFVQDAPNVGSLFTNDKVTYKIRHIYGGAVLVDGFKGTTKAVVA